MKTIVRLVTISLLLVVGVGEMWGDATCTLSNANIVAGTTAATGYGSKSATDGCGNTWNAYAVKNYHSNATSSYHYLQIKAYASSTAYYIQVPTMPGVIKSISMVVSGASAPRGDGGNSNTLYFSASNNSSTAASGAAANPATAVSGTGSSSVTLNCEDLGLKGGYITANGAVRIWGDIVVTYIDGDAITLDKNNSDVSGSTSGSGMIAANATSLTSGFTPPARTGYSVEGYYTTSGCTTKIATNLGALQPNITVDAKQWTNGSSQWKKGGTATFYTKWTANPYTVTLNDNGGSGGSDSKIVTFNANTNMTSAVAIPTKKHYIFGGYWTSANSGATLDTKVIDSDGTWVASVSGYTDATPNWIKADNVTLYAKWTEHTYTNYRTTCCTELGAIGGNVEFTNPTTAVLTWNNLSHVHASTPYTIKYKTHDAGGYTTFDGSITNVAGKKTCTITGLSCNTSYDFKIEVTAADGYCDKDSVMEDKNSGKWTVNYTLTGITKSSGPDEGANVCGDYSAVFAVSTVAYELPANITVTIGGEAATADDDYTWNNSTGALSLASAKITGTIAISIAGDLVGCVADPSIGAVSLSGTFNLGSVGVTVATSGTGANTCAWTDYGFVWGTSSNPTVSNNKVQVGNDGNATTWNGSLTSTFAVGTTYYYRAYGKNSKNDAIYYYSTSDGTFTPRSVTFNSNGGDAVATVYVNSGGTISAPSAPTKTGYTFSKWQLSGADYNFSSAVNINITLDAVWNAKTMTVTLDNQSATTAGAGSVTGTYAAGLPSIAANMPAKTGYTFQGYFASTGGSGTRYIKPDGTADANWDKEVATSIYAHWTANDYTITLNNEGADSGEEGTESISVTFNANTNLTNAITNPTKTGYRFDGYFTDTNGSGSQIIGSDGNVIASVASYTSATKQWIYAGDVELHAKWTAVRTVTWSVDGDTWSSGVVDGNTYVINGEKVSALPTAPTSSDCDDAKVFMGWRATAIEGVSVSDPGSIFTTKAGSPAITANTTFYAVFADENKGSRTTLYNEPFKGTCSDNTDWASASSYFDDANTASIVTTDSWKVSKYTTETSEDGYTGASGGSHTFCGSNGKDIVFNFGDKSAYLDLQLSFGFRNNAAGGSSRSISCTISGDGGDTWGSNIIDVASITDQSWHFVSYDISNSSSGALKVKFSTTAGNASRVDDIKLTGCAKTYSNYVTSCASCDADATYTNTTPTVSDIDCTSATLTMEDGLATVGSEGCHISDYGFVIGTSDNPAIGGVGVTKLQVGTTDPTIGEDFSYDATELTKGTHYYIRAYAINRHGTAYSTSTNFWTKNVSSIAITTAPTKTNYIVGETFDATGMVVTATMASSATENVTSDVTYSTSALTAGASQNFAINYSLCETAKSVNQVINVYTLTVNEGTNPSYGTANNSSANIVSITGLGEHKTYTVTVTSSNATAVDNGDNTWSIINPTGNVTVRVDYAAASQVKVYYKVDGVAVTGLTQDVWQSETTTLPTASELATAMTAQSMDIPDDDYPNFWGWSETEFPAQTAEPSIVTGTPTINTEKIYYAVYTNLNKKRIVPSDFMNAYASNEGAKTIDGLGYNIHDICLSSSKIQFKSSPGHLYSTGALTYIKKIEITGLGLIVNVCSDNAGTVSGDAITPSGTTPYVYTFPASKQYFKIKGLGGTDKVSLIEIFYANSTVYYMTEFCATKITLTKNSPSHGTIAFGRSSLATCGSDKDVSLTITPDPGYQLTGWTVNTTSGYADAKTTTPAVVKNNNNSAAQNITLTFAEDANKNYDVTATFGLLTVSSWTWTYNSAAMPNPLNLYIGQTAKLDVAYTPAGVDASKKTYTRTKDDIYINWSGAAQATYSTISGRASTGENTTEVTFTHADGPSTTINVKVLPLPAVHFVDNVHNVGFDDVVATLSGNALLPTKTTPTHADFSGSYLNSCEEQHLHLVGWIREDWPALVTYMNGGAQPNTAAITGAGNDDLGNAYFFAPGADINVLTFNGKTFYAVWAKVE